MKIFARTIAVLAFSAACICFFGAGWLSVNHYFGYSALWFMLGIVNMALFYVSYFMVREP